MRNSHNPTSIAYRIDTLATAFFTFSLIVVGALVRVSGSGLGCPDWPLCHGQLIPPFEFHTLVEYSHRLTSTFVTILVIATAFWTWLRYRSHTWLLRSAILAVVLLFIQILLGGITVLAELPPTIVAVHLGNAMLLFASVLTVASLAWRSGSLAQLYKVGEETSGGQGSGSGSGLGEGDAKRVIRLILLSAAAVLAIIVSGSIVEGSGAAMSCRSWPLCNDGQLLTPGALAAIHMLHRLLVGAGGLFTLYSFFRAAKLTETSRSIYLISLLGALVLIAQVFVGAAQVWLEFPPLLEGAHVALASAVWGICIVLAHLVRPLITTRRDENRDRFHPIKTPIRSGVANYFALTKPWIVALLLTTTLAGMLVAAGGIPPLPVLILTLLGGGFAAGGANALNSYIDRDVDKVMGRTSRRPLPSGLISPRRALVFALTLCGLAPLVLGFGVNWLSACLAVIGIIYYAGIYTIILKRATPQNIVVGGAAGAIPPLVGWAAVSNDLSLLSLYLFAIILLWTPPHTWALMLLLDKDYHRAKIPMLPAAWGQVEARRQIILYSVLLFVTTLIPFSIGALGVAYFAGALILGVYFLLLALRLWRNGEAYKPIAKKLYHFSNAYLALLFLMMVVDHWLPTWRV